MLEGIPCKCGIYYMLKRIREFQDALGNHSLIDIKYIKKGECFI